MSIKSEFEDLADELFVEFEVGKEPREQITLENAGVFHPVTGPTAGEKKSGVFMPSSYQVNEVNNSIHTSDIKGVFRCSDWEGFKITTDTKAVDGTGEKYEIKSINPSPKDVIYVVQLRRL